MYKTNGARIKKRIGIATSFLAGQTRYSFVGQSHGSFMIGSKPDQSITIARTTKKRIISTIIRLTSCYSTLYAYFDARVPEPFLPRTLPPLRPASRACSLVNLCPVPSFCARLPPLLATSRLSTGSIAAKPRGLPVGSYVISITPFSRCYHIPRYGHNCV